MSLRQLLGMGGFKNKNFAVILLTKFIFVIYKEEGSLGLFSSNYLKSLEVSNSASRCNNTDI